MPDNTLHITVGVAPTGKLDLTHELKLLKSALLYADKIKLCSLTSSSVISLASLFDIKGKDVLDLVLKVLETTGDDRLALAQSYKSIKRKKYHTSKELIIMNTVERRLLQACPEIKQKALDMVIEAGGEGLAVALNSGLVEVQAFNLDKGTDVIDDYFGIICDSVRSPDTYPLFDNPTGELIDGAIELGKIKMLGIYNDRAKQVGLSSNLFNRLPLFENATIDEIIDIRKELDSPLKRYRSAIIGFSREIESAPWNSDFPAEAEQVFREHVEPAVLEIEEAYKSNSSIRNVFSNALTNVPESPFIGVALSQISSDNAIVAALAGFAALATGTFRAYQRHKDDKNDIAKNDLYFYYKVKQSLT